jgi:DNA-binding XRE family transcriptional regulator
MKSKPNLLIVSKTIGTSSLPVAPREHSDNVKYVEFGVAATKPLKGSVTLSDFVAELETDETMALHLKEARKTLGPLLGSNLSLRQLRLAAGLSQAKLGAAAGITQSHIARIESGSCDPGTETVAKLAHAIGVPDVEVFRAIRNQSYKGD